MEKKLIAKWVSKSGKHWLEVYVDRFGCTFSHNNGSGNLGNITVCEALNRMEDRVNTGEFLPDGAKTPMRRAM